MIPSYEQEVRHKRRIARIFWVIVFLFATILYLFFKGYYLSINFSMKDFLSQSGQTQTGSRDISIQSFGMIDVTIKNPDATAILSGSSQSGIVYGNGEKKMVNYSPYQMFITSLWHLENTISFDINKTTEFYIDEITLIPTPSYTELSGSTLDHITKLSDGSFISETASGMIAWDPYFSTGKLIGTKKLRHIGEGKYLSTNSNIVEYNKSLGTWESRTISPTLRSLIQNCPSLQYIGGMPWCEANHTLVTEKWTTLTGVTVVTPRYIAQNELFTFGDIDGFAPRQVSITGATDDLQITSYKDIWYHSGSGGLLFPIFGKNQTPLDTKLDEIEHLDGGHEFLIAVGKKWGNRYISLLSSRDPSHPRLVDFPDRELRDIRITEVDRNFYIKWRDFLLFLYRGSDQIKWLVDGEIMAVGSDFSFYKKDGKIWKALWRDPVLFAEKIR